MRIFLLALAVVLSALVVVLAYLFLSSAISSLVYTILSSGFAILLIFALFHFIYLYLSKKSK